MTLRQRIVDEIARTISRTEAYNANVCLGLLIAHFNECANAFLSATSEQLTHFLTSRENTASTVARRHSTLRIIFSILLKWGLIDEDPSVDVKRPLIAERAPDFGTPALVDKLISRQKDIVERASPETAYAEQLTLALIHLVASGVFLAEIGALVVRDLGENQISAGRGTHRARPVWLSSSAQVAINVSVHARRPLPPDPNSPLLISSRFGVALSTQVVWTILQRAIVRTGLAGRGLTPAKIHRSATADLIDRGLGWQVARNPSKYKTLRLTRGRPPFENLEAAIERNHPLENA